MAWTTDDLAKLEDAIKLGATRVKYADKEVEYRSLNEMIRIRRLMRHELGLETGDRRILMEFKKGTDE